MDLQKILNNKEIKAKEKTIAISQMLLDGKIIIAELIEFAQTCKDPGKATCIEAIEFATKTKPEITSLASFNFLSKALAEKAPRIKWESAKVIGNIAHLYPAKLTGPIKNLLINAEHSGTIVRWSAAFALAQIIKLKSSFNKDLIPAIESICKREEKNSIRKIYLEALNQIKK